MAFDASNFIASCLLLFAMFHAFTYASVYLMTVFKVVLNSEKSKVNKAPTRIVAAIYFFFYLVYNIAIYTLVLSIVNWKGLFRERLWNGSVFDNDLAFLLYYEPALLILTTWFKIACATHSWISAPSHATLMREANRHKRKKKKPALPSQQSSRISKHLQKQKRRSDSKVIDIDALELDDNAQDDDGGNTELPFVTVVMPIYNEPITTLMTAVNSVTEVEYPLERIHLVLAFDDDRLTEIYRAVMYCLTHGDEKHNFKELGSEEGLNKLGASVDSIKYPKMCDIMYRSVLVTPCRFEHGGKRHAQMCAYYYLDAKHAGHVKKPLLLFIDSDIQLDPYAINYFVHDLNIKDKHSSNGGLRREALTGLITCKTAGTYNFWKVLQDTEYIESQMLHRNTEDYLGSVTCLPGALTMVRFESLRGVAGIYFNAMEASSSLDFQRCHLGEDRYLTHLLMESRRTKYRIGFCPAAKCKTEGCEDWRSLMKQRRRWYLGTLANEIYMLTSPALWSRFTALMIMATITSLKNGPLFVYVFVSEALNGRSTPLSLAYVGLIFVPIWLFVMLYGVKLRRLKILWCYPIILLMLPIMSACFQFYGMMTLSVRTWGGPRADADKNTTDATTNAVAAAANSGSGEKSKKLSSKNSGSDAKPDANDLEKQLAAAAAAPELAQAPGYSPRKALRSDSITSPRQRARAMQMPVRAEPA